MRPLFRNIKKFAKTIASRSGGYLIPGGLPRLKKFNKLLIEKIPIISIRVSNNSGVSLIMASGPRLKSGIGRACSCPLDPNALLGGRKISMIFLM